MAFLRAYELSGELFFAILSVILFILLVFFICLVGYFTIRAIIKNEICVIEQP
ncbi:hypothetical protein [Campylobacter sp. CCUG 57310]|uniref:hypothetical protein n=1 Tax=Campylobacter sp. CCUG 57310 TaxID=2517362 RepID=UPI0020B1557F|nr:hypothetical protein [Campylobacter sp. CCUG 57310]